MHAVVALVLAFSASVQTPYDTVFDQIKNLAALPNAVAAVHGLVLHRDVLELHLDDGVAYQLTPVAGRTTAIAWVGSGSLSFVPPLLVEQFNLKRVLGDSTINGPITAARSAPGSITSWMAAAIMPTRVSSPLSSITRRRDSSPPTSSASVAR